MFYFLLFSGRDIIILSTSFQKFYIIIKDLWFDFRWNVPSFLKSYIILFTT